MTLGQIRATIINAIASDKELARFLVFKGGNALEMVHHVGDRSSVDMDFSMEDDVDDANQISDRLFSALRAKFAESGLVLFGEVFAPRPTDRQPRALWGGYFAEFKLISRDLFEGLSGELQAIQRQAIESGPNHRRRFRIEISPFEYCDDKVAMSINGSPLYVYSLQMIAAEKLRAICQQDPDYPLRVNPAPRARDFYDICATIIEAHVDFADPNFHDLTRKIFAAKEVDLRLIRRIHLHREFHRADWPSVQVAVRTKLREFDYYFEVVLAEIEKLDPLGIE